MENKIRYQRMSGSWNTVFIDDMDSLNYLIDWAIRKKDYEQLYHLLKFKYNTDWSSNNEGTITNERYPMCKDQPAQIDCRNTDCIFNKNGSCTNESPAITLNKDGKFKCWSEITKE